jgi:Na+-transporting methylmalonyl-CoA/oxaloacetate decarboxylase gamma subunit
LVTGVASAAGAASFFTALAMLAFFAVFGFLALLVAFTSVAGAVTPTAGAATSAAKTTAEKDKATRAATSVERTFFICESSKRFEFDLYFAFQMPALSPHVTY